MEILWEDLCQHSEDIHSPLWHQDILLHREENIQKGIEFFSDWEEAKRKIRNSVS
jgi:hypothetical protein